MPTDSSRSHLRRAGLTAALALGSFFAQTARADDPAAPPTPSSEPEKDKAEPKPPEPKPQARSVDVRASAEVGGYQDSHAVSVLTPTVALAVESPTGGWSASARYLADVVSAASPDIVATASPRWTETRHAGTIGAQYKPGNFGGGVNAGFSYTNDYLALNGGGRLLLDLDDKNWTLLGAYNFGHDTVGRTGTAFTIFARPVDFHTATLGVTRLLGPSSLIAFTFDGIYEHGDQSKPYRYVPMFAPGVGDKLGAGASADDVARLRIQARPLEQLPLERARGALTGRFAYRGAGFTLRVEERLYADSWSMLASTTDVRVPFDVGSRVIVWPHVRANAQKGASFYQRTYTATSAADLPALRTGDRELGPLYTGGLGMGARFGLGSSMEPFSWALTTTLDGYYTRFTDALYVTDRISGLLSVGAEATF